MTHVPIAVEGLDDHGEPSGAWLEVVEVSLVDVHGHEIGRFKDQKELWEAIKNNAVWKVVAVKTTGLPRADITCDIQCDELKT